MFPAWLVGFGVWRVTHLVSVPLRAAVGFLV